MYRKIPKHEKNIQGVSAWDKIQAVGYLTIHAITDMKRYFDSSNQWKDFINFFQNLTSDGDGGDETKQQKNKEYSETALIFRDGAAASEEANDHDDPTQDQESHRGHLNHTCSGKW